MSHALKLPASSTESQWLYTPHELADSPSVRAGLTVQQELHGRARAIKRLWALRNYQTVCVMHSSRCRTGTEHSPAAKDTIGGGQTATNP